MRRIRGRKALVTGAASGIGRAIALALAREGADLFLLDIDAAKLAATAREAESLGVSVVLHPCDLSQPAEVTAAAQALRVRWGRLHMIVNNAGLTYYGRTEEMTSDQCRRILSVNLLAPIALVLDLIQLLMVEDEAHVLNVGSIFGLTVFRKGAAYQTSKFGLVGFSLALRAEYVRQGIGVTVLCPGFVRTPMLETDAIGASQQAPSIPGWASMSPERVAAVAIRAIRRDRGLVVVPLLARLLWWLTRISPAFVGWLVREGWRPSRRATPAPD